MDYFTNVSASGPVRYNQFPFTIGVLVALDKPIHGGTPHAPSIDP